MRLTRADVDRNDKVFDKAKENMAPSRRSIFEFDDHITRKIFLLLLVAMSTRHAHWYHTFWETSRDTRRIVNGLLEKPDVLKLLTFWDSALISRETAANTMFEQKAAKGLEKLKTIKIIVTDSISGGKVHLLSHLTSLQHLDIRGPTAQRLSTYLRILKKHTHITHLTTDCWMDVNTAARTDWPSRVTLVHTAPSVEHLVTVAVEAYIGGMDELEIGPSSSEASRQLFEAAVPLMPAPGRTSLPWEVLMLRPTAPRLPIAMRLVDQS